MDEIIAEFIAETNENLEELDNDLVTLEQNPNDEELIARIFRVLHTIKGTCGFLGLSRLESIAHKGEDVLGLFRDKKLEVKPAYVTLIFESFDKIKEIVSAIETTGEEPSGDDTALLAKLQAAYNGEDIGGDETSPSAETPPTETSSDEFEIFHEEEEEKEPESEELEAEEPQDKAAENAANPKEQQAAAAKSTSTGSLRVAVDVLENLMTIVSELVLTRNQLLQIARQSNNDEYLSSLQRLNLVVSELQEGVMKTRMQPVGNAWAKLPRIIRDLSHELGKKVDLEMHGQDTELDRQVLDLIKDPLTHMVRNSADHGIELPEERIAKGKNPTGKVVLNAYHQGGHINIEISDDGKGLSTEKIKKKILEKELATPDELEEMTTKQIQQFIFNASFSTAEKVTSVSGRGVGMDVVRSNIEKIGGSIEMRSEEDVGTTFTIRIPLTLAIMSSLIIEVSGQRFAIPQLAVSELVRIGMQTNDIENINGTPVLRLREQLLPLVCLSDLFGLEEAEDKKSKYIVVTKVGSYMFGLIVDDVYEFEEIVVKPLAKNLKNIAVFSGNTILGDGNVIMILDPVGILKTVGIQDVVESHEEEQTQHTDQGPETLLLLFRAGNNTMKAVPLDMVSRLEEITIDKIEYAKGNQVIQYLDHLMPVFNIDTNAVESKTRPLIILKHEGKNAGLMVDQILDVTKYYGEIDNDSHGNVLGSIIINENAADVINGTSFANQGTLINEETVNG